jgi:hypothetical protein
MLLLGIWILLITGFSIYLKRYDEYYRDTSWVDSLLTSVVLISLLFSVAAVFVVKNPDVTLRSINCYLERY